MFKQSPEKQAVKLIKNGLTYLKKKKYRQAVKEFQQALKLLGPNREVYALMVEALNQYNQEWGQEEFALSLDCTMKLQELDNPAIQLLHQTLTPEYQEIYRLAERLFLAPEETREQNLLAEILVKKEQAVLPLANFILSLKKIATP